MANLSNINNKFLVTTGGEVLVGRTAATGTSKLQVSGSLLIGTDISSGIPLVVQETTANGFAIGFMRNTNTTNGNGLVIDVNSTGGAYIQDWRQASTVKMRLLQNGNLGIGTDSPNQLLELSKNGSPVMRLNSSKTTNGAIGDSIGRIEWRGSNNAGNGAGIKAAIDTSATSTTQRDFDILFKTGNNIGSGEPPTRMRIDADGNVGIGTDSPNNLLNLSRNVANGDVATYIQNFNADVGSTDETASVIFAHGNDGVVGYVGGKLVCGKEGDFETSIANIKGNLQFYTASGTSLDSDVNNIERMRITSGGMVGIGTISPLHNLQIGTAATNGSYSMMIEGNFANTALASNPRLNLIDTNFGITAGKYGSGGADDALGIFGFQGAGRGILFAHTTAGSSTHLKDMRHDMFIDGGTGDVGIGTTSPGRKLDVSSTSSGVIAKFTGPNAYNAESGLEFSVGRAKISGFLNGTGGTPGTSLRFYTMPDGGSVTERMRITSAGRIFMDSLDGKTQVHPDVSYRTSDGELFYQTSSERYKTDIVNLESSLNKVNSLRPVRFIDVNTNEPGFGLIAEETNKIIPDVVFSKDDQIEGISYSNLTPFLIKAIQELKAEIDELKK